MRALRHGGALIGVGPPATLGNESVAEGAEKREGRIGGPFTGLTGARAMVWQPGDGYEVATVEKLDSRGAQARREGKKSTGRCGEKRRGSPPFIRVAGAPGRWQRVVTAGLMAFKPLMARGG
jgi:hypothetical protein